MCHWPEYARLFNEIGVAVWDRQANQPDKTRFVAKTGKSGLMGRPSVTHTESTPFFRQDRSDKDFYLSKKYAQAHLEHYLDGENDPN